MEGEGGGGGRDRALLLQIDVIVLGAASRGGEGRTSVKKFRFCFIVGLYKLPYWLVGSNLYKSNWLVRT